MSSLDAVVCCGRWVGCCSPIRQAGSELQAIRMMAEDTHLPQWIWQMQTLNLLKTGSVESIAGINMKQLPKRLPLYRSTCIYFHVLGIDHQ